MVIIGRLVGAGGWLVALWAAISTVLEGWHVASDPSISAYLVLAVMSGTGPIVLGLALVWLGKRLAAMGERRAAARTAKA